MTLLELAPDDDPLNRIAAEALGHVALCAASRAEEWSEQLESEGQLEAEVVWGALCIGQPTSLFARHDFRKRCTVQWFCIETSAARRVDSFRPADVEVKSIGAPAVFWPRLGRQRAREPKIPPPPAPLEDGGPDIGDRDPLAAEDVAPWVIEAEAIADMAEEFDVAENPSDGHAPELGCPSEASEASEASFADSADTPCMSESSAGQSVRDGSPTVSRPAPPPNMSEARPEAPPGDAPAQIAPPSRRPPRFEGRNMIWEVPGGRIVFNVTAGSLDAHCGNPSHANARNPCRLNRTVSRGSRNPAQGRPIGMLLAWLSVSDSFPSRAAHHAARSDGSVLSLVLRRELRIWAMSERLGALEHEGARRPGEDEEPEGLA